MEPIERYRAYLTDVDQSPNTVRAYAYDLKDYGTFLAHRGLNGRAVRLEDLGEYVVCLQPPPSGRKGHIAVLPLGRATRQRPRSTASCPRGSRCPPTWYATVSMPAIS